MGAITGGAAQRAARDMLRDVIRDELKRGELSSTSEMIGYWLNGVRGRENYYAADEETVKRRIAAPEFLTGLLKDDTA